MSDKEFQILKIYNEYKQIPWHELRLKHIATSTFMDWAENKNDVEMVVSNINSKLESYKLIERIPRNIAIDQTSKITVDGESVYFSEAEKRNICPLTNLEINFVNYIIDSIKKYSWKFELDITQLSGRYFFAEKINDDQLKTKTKENVIKYLRQNDFIDLKPGYISVYEFIEPKGRALHKFGSIELFLQKEKDHRNSMLSNNNTIINTNGNNNVIVTGVSDSNVEVYK